MKSIDDVEGEEIAEPVEEEDVTPNGVRFGVDSFRRRLSSALHRRQLGRHFFRHGRRIAVLFQTGAHRFAVGRPHVFPHVGQEQGDVVHFAQNGRYVDDGESISVAQVDVRMEVSDEVVGQLNGVRFGHEVEKRRPQSQVSVVDVGAGPDQPLDEPLCLPQFVPLNSQNGQMNHRVASVVLGHEIIRLHFALEGGEGNAPDGRKVRIAETPQEREPLVIVRYISPCFRLSQKEPHGPRRFVEQMERSEAVELAIDIRSGVDQQLEQTDVVPPSPPTAFDVRPANAVEGRPPVFVLIVDSAPDQLD